MMVNDFPKLSTATYKLSADPFTAELQPRSDLTAHYIDPPVERSDGYVGGAEHVTASVVIWLSREAGEDGRGAALDMAEDLGRLRRAVLDLEVDGDDLAIHDGITTTVFPRREGAVVVVGVLRVVLDYDEGA